MLIGYKGAHGSSILDGLLFILIGEQEEKILWMLGFWDFCNDDGLEVVVMIVIVMLAIQYRR